jgi:hypothetical protein
MYRAYMVYWYGDWGVMRRLSYVDILGVGDRVSEVYFCAIRNWKSETSEHREYDAYAEKVVSLCHRRYNKGNSYVVE